LRSTTSNTSASREAAVRTSSIPALSPIKREPAPSPPSASASPADAARP
jgi:hypothetical protein